MTDYIWEKLDGEGDEKTIGNVNVTAYGPTVVGSEEDEVMIVIDNSGLTNYTDSVTGSNYKLSDVKNRTIKSGVTGLDLPILPLGAFQISLGTLYGTRGTFRFLPPIDVDEKIGKVSYYGGALQHNPKMFLPALDILPFDLDVSGSYLFYSYNYDAPADICRDHVCRTADNPNQLQTSYLPFYKENSLTSLL